MPAKADVYTRALLGVLTRARARFDVAAISALTPGLTVQQRAAALLREQEYAQMWEEKARDRIRKRLEADASLAVALAMLPKERNILAMHIAMTGLRMAARSDLGALRAAGETHGYWLRSDRPWDESCEECRRHSGRLWPLDFLERKGPPRHPHCGCKVISPAAARAWGMVVEDPIALTEAMADSAPAAPAYTSLVEATAGVLEVVDRIEQDARVDMTAAAAERLAGVLREAMVPVWREADHPRGKTTPKSNRGSFRAKRLDLGEVPAWLAMSFKKLSQAAERGDLAGLERAYDAMVTNAKRMEPGPREEALRFATRARAAVFNPTGRRVRTGELFDLGNGQTIPMPLGIPSLGQAGPWAPTDDGGATFRWEIHPGALGPEHDGLIASMKQLRMFTATEVSGGVVRLQSSPGRSTSEANSDARALEIMSPQLRAMRIVEPGIDLADSTPIDPDEKEVSLRVRQTTWYPGVSTRMLGDAGENLIDAVAMRMWELGIYNKGEPIEFPSLASADRTSALDWVIGNRGIDFKADAMRSLYPSMQQVASTIDAEHRPDKIAAVTRRGLQPTIMVGYTDLDNDVAHVFMHDYPDPATMFKEIRPPMALVDRLVAGDIKPGDDETARFGTRAGQGDHRWVFIGTFRLAYNPYMSRLDANVTPQAMMSHLQASRARAAKKRPMDMGVRAPLSAPMDRPTAAEAKDEAIMSRLEQRVARDERIEQLARQNVKQEVIASELGLTQARVSQILSERRKLDPTVPIPSKGRKNRPGINDAVRRAQAPVHRHGAGHGHGEETSTGGFRGPRQTQGPSVPASTQRQRLRREALRHLDAGLSVVQIAAKMGLLPAYVAELLTDSD